MADAWPVRLITIDAREELEEWYVKEGFIRMKRNTIGQDGVTVAMYYDCKKFSKELKEYMEDFYE